MKFIDKFFSFLENCPLNFNTWLISFFSLVVFRIMAEDFIFFLKSQPLILFVSFFIHTFLFFLILYLVFLVFLKKLLKEETKKVANVLLWGYWLIIFPPILDRLIFGQKDVWSFYYFGGFKELLIGFFTFFGKNLMVGVTLGSRLMIAAVFLLGLLYVFSKTKSLLKTAIAAVVFYLIFFFFGSFPSFVGIILKIFQGKDFFAIASADIASIFLVPVDFFNLKESIVKVALTYRLNLIFGIGLFLFLTLWQWRDNKEKFWALVKNVRYPQMVFNGGLLLLGAGLGWFYYPQNFTGDFFSVLIIINLILVVFSAWFFSVFVNDIYDLKIDQQTNIQRPLVKKIFSLEEYKNYALVFLLFSLLISLAINIKIFLLIAGYHFLTSVYSIYPFRLKRILVIASVISSFASLLFMFCGFLLFSENQTLALFPFPAVILLFFSFTCVIPLKDLKDALSDRQNKVYTLPALVGEKNARSILAAAIFLLYFFSVYVVNETRIFLPALVFGAISFWIISSERISVRKISGWILIPAILYGLSILRVIFLNHL